MHLVEFIFYLFFHQKKEKNPIQFEIVEELNNNNNNNNNKTKTNV